MYRLSRWIVAVVAVAVAGLPLAACGQLPSTTAKQHDPVTVEPVGNAGVKRLTIEDRAVERLGLTTAPVVEERTPPARPGQPDGVRLLMPYAALLYLPDGTTFAYTNPDGHTYVRQNVTVESVRGNQVVLNAGPPAGTAVVTAGGAELWGAEFGIK